MKSDAKKVVSIAKAEGRTELWKIQCDLFYLPDGRPVAILEWGSDMGLLDARYVPLRPELLFESKQAGIALDYQNMNHPIEIPKDLTTQPDGLTQEAFRRGWLRVE